MLTAANQGIVASRKRDISRFMQTCLLAATCIFSVGQALAADLDANIAIWSSKGQSIAFGTHDTKCSVTLDSGELIDANLTKLLAARFSEIETVPKLRDGLVVRLQYEKYHWPLGKEHQVGWGTWENEMTFSYLAIVFMDSKQLWERKFDFQESIVVSRNCTPDNWRQAIVRSIEKAAAQLSTAMASDPALLAAIEDAAATKSPQSLAELQNLQPLLATYRVTESEGTIRKQPNAKAGTVRKIGMGSIVQIIGTLPTGWLQVAKEGDAIGWIHSDSVTLLSSQQAVTPAATAQRVVPVAPSRPVVTPPAASSDAFPSKPVAVTFARGKPSPDDIAVIIGNANYRATTKDIPDVVPAYADAEGMKRYAIQALGIKEENVMFIKDARLADLIATFGNESNPKGKLWNWVKAERSQVFVFYSGHGAPSSDGASSYLVPVDATSSLIDLSGYPLKTLYANLGKLPARSVTVVLEACFSGATQTGMLVKNASPVYQKAMQEMVPTNLTVISAGSGNQIASWEQDKSSSLFTKYFLLGMAGAADKKPHGNGDGKVTNEELGRYLAETVSYSAQRYYGREQTAQILAGGR